MTSTPAFNLRVRDYDPKNALFFARVSQLSCLPPDDIERFVKKEWGFETVEFFEESGTRAFLISDREGVVVSFRGTEPSKLKDWWSDGNCVPWPGPLGPVHVGFLDALDHVWGDLSGALGQLRKKERAVWFTGHGVGGALANLAVARCLATEAPVDGLYTFGQPRVGVSSFTARFKELFAPGFFRFVNHGDIVPRVPPRSRGYDQIDECFYFDVAGNLRRNAATWKRALSSVKGTKGNALERYHFLTEMFPGWVSAHSIEAYIRNLEKNL